jgi:predicted O-methyltransferase YrrM
MIQLVLNEEVNNESMEDYCPYVEWCGGMLDFFNGSPGKEHYKLIAFLAKQFPENSLFIDIGTAEGHSACALTANPTARVITYDLLDRIESNSYTFGKKTICNHPRIDYRIKNCLLEPEYINLKDSPLIFLDVDPHDGSQETQIVNMLLCLEFRGIVLCDDIHLNDGMKNWWSNGVPPQVKKLDLTKYGHWSGTGALIFDPTFVDIQVD